MESAPIYGNLRLYAYAAAGLLSAAAFGAKAEAQEPIVDPACGNPLTNASSTRQAAAMLCLTNHARLIYGEAPLTEDPALDEAARSKDRDLITYGFSHNAGNRPWWYYIREYSQYSQYGENLAWGADFYLGKDGSEHYVGKGSCANTRAIFGGLMHSATHRANILDPYFQDVGIAVKKDRQDGSSYWTIEFGSNSLQPLPPLPPEVQTPTRCNPNPKIHFGFRIRRQF